MPKEEKPAPSRIPPSLTLYQLSIGHYVSRALNVAAKLDIADLLKDGPRTADDLAAATKTHPASLRRVMRLLVSVGVFEETADGSFALTPVGECLRSEVPGSSRAMVMLFAGERMQDAWKDLQYCVRTGDPAYRRRGVTDPFLDPARTPEETAIFDAAMADFTRTAAVVVAATYDFKSVRTAVDVGGGNGALLLGIMKAYPSLRGVVFDQASAVERAKAQIAANGLVERCEAMAGDFFKEVPTGGDAYLLKHVIHDWDDARAIAILKNCRRVMKPEGRLLILEGVYPARIDNSLESRGAAANDVNMLVNTGGRQRSEEEFRSLFEASGFSLKRIIPTPARLAVIEGVPA